MSAHVRLQVAFSDGPCCIASPLGTDQHLVLLAAQDGAFARLDPSEQQRTEAALRRASDFFAQVICRFILRDLGVLLDKCESPPKLK